MSKDLDCSIFDADVLTLEVSKNNTEKVKKLLEKGVDLNRKNSVGYRAIEVAFNEWNFEMVSLLVKFGAHMTADDKQRQDTIIFSLAEIKDTFYYFMLQSKRPSTFNFNSAGSNGRINRLVRRRPDLVEALIAFGHNPQTYVDATVNHGTVENLKQLINFCVTLPNYFSVGTDIAIKLYWIAQYTSLSETERKDTAIRTLQTAKKKLAKKMLKFAHYEILNISIALRSLRIPVYVLLEIVKRFPNYDFFSDFQIVHVLEKVRKTLYK